MPEVLTCGDHAKVDKWRRKKQIERTMEKRPDMFEKLSFEDKEGIADSIENYNKTVEKLKIEPETTVTVTITE